MNETIAQKLIELGWKEYPVTLPSQGAIEEHFFQKVVPDVFGCLTNEKIFVNLRYCRHLNDPPYCWTLDVQGEPNKSKWIKLQSYTIDSENLFDCLPIEERKLVAAWRAIVDIANEAAIDE